jgi:WD40 repeat protein
MRAAAMKYWAFLSYSHTDAKWGDWLHKALETYRVPRRLIGKESRDGKIPERVFPIFRDREELPVSADLSININEALEQSLYLIVVCSPRSAQSRWVGEEIKTFKRLGREDRILALIVDGEPNASDGKPGFKVEEECFHELMRHRLAPDGTITAQQTEPIAADVREGKDGKTNAKLKLIAGLLGVNYDDLKQREQERRLRRTHKILAAAAVLIVAFAALWVALFYKQQEAHTQHLEAARARGEANARRGEAEQARDEATRRRDEARATLSRSDFLQALRSIDDDRDLDALAQLSRSLRFDPENQTAECRLATLLAYREYPTKALRFKHDAEVASAQFNPKGNLILTVSGGNVRVWDARAGRPLGSAMKHEAMVNSVQFSPDGKRIVVACGNEVEGASGEARVWDVETGKPVTQPMKYANPVRSAEFSPDGKQIVIASANFFGVAFGDAQICDAQTGATVIELIKSKAVEAAQFSPDGRQILTISNYEAQIWDAKTGKRLSEIKKSSSDSLRYSRFSSAHFSPNGKRVVTLSAGGVAQVWNIESGKPITEKMGIDGKGESAEFSPDGTRVATCGCNGANCTTTVWDTETGKKIGVSAAGRYVEFSPHGQRLMTVSENAVRLWNAGWVERDINGNRDFDPETGRPVTEPVKDSHFVCSPQFSRDGSRIVTVSGNVVEVWDIRPGKARSEPLKEDVLEVHLSPDGARIVTVSRDNVAQVWNVATGKPLIKPIRDVIWARFSPDGRRVLTCSAINASARTQFFADGRRTLTGSNDRTLQLWNAENGDPITEPIKRTDLVSSASFSADGKRIVTASGTQTQIWDAQSGTAIGEPMKHDLPVLSAEFSLSSNYIATVSGRMEDGIVNGQVEIWDASSFRRLNLPLMRGSSAHFSADGLKVATVSQGQIQVWDVKAGKRLLEPISHSDGLYGITSAQFSPDDKRIVSVAQDQIRIWDAESFAPLSKHIACENAYTARFSRDARRIMSELSGPATSVESARIWDIETGKALIEPLQEQSALTARFSSGGKRLLTVSLAREGHHHISKLGNEERVWDITPEAKVAPQWLPPLAEAVAGQHLNDVGVFEPLSEDPTKSLNALKEQLEHAPADDEWAIWGRWFLADHSTRTISPFSKITVPEYIENRIKENTPESLDEAEELAVGNRELLQRIKKAREALRAR